MIITKDAYIRYNQLKNIKIRMFNNNISYAAEYFLLKEMLRQLFNLNCELNILKNEKLFNWAILSRYLNSTEIELLSKKSLICYDEIGLIGSFGHTFAALYTNFEILINNKRTFVSNPYSNFIKVIERGFSLDKENYPKAIKIGLYELPILNLQKYSQSIPYIICDNDKYLDAINNYYEHFNINSYEDMTKTPSWLVEDNQRGFISDEYLKWF